MKTMWTLCAAAAPLLLAGCTAADASTPIPTVTITQTVTASPTTATSPTVAAPLGQAQSFGPDGNATVFAYTPDVAKKAPRPQSGGRWDAADVQVCLTVPGETVSDAPWALVDDKNGLSGPSNITYAAFPTPEYPLTDTRLAAGECVRGWIGFAVSADAHVVTVRYGATDQPLRWTV